MKKKLEFIRRVSDVFFYSFLFGMCFSLGAMFASRRPIRSFACMLICMILMFAMAMLYVRVDKLIKTFHIDETEEKAA